MTRETSEGMKFGEKRPRNTNNTLCSAYFRALSIFPVFSLFTIDERRRR